MRTAFRFARLALGVSVALVVLVLLFVWRLSAGPIRLAFLDRPIAAAIAGLAPGLTAEVGATALARSGRGVALEVSAVRLRARDGTPILSLPELAVRPSLGALVRGRIVIARVDVADAALALTRRADGAWLLGTDEGGAGVAVAVSSARRRRRSSSEQAAAAHRSHAARASRVDDQRAGGKLELAERRAPAVAARRASRR